MLGCRSIGHITLKLRPSLPPRPLQWASTAPVPADPAAGPAPSETAIPAIAYSFLSSLSLSLSLSLKRCMQIAHALALSP